MEEFLFKAQVKYNGNHLFAGDFVEGSLIIKTSGHFIYVIEKDELDNVIREFEVEVIPETVVQFIGLFDKNGNKIFNKSTLNDKMGSIVTVSYGEFDAGRDDYGVNYIPLGFHVIFSDGGKYCINKDGDGYAISASECEIIK